MTGETIRTLATLLPEYSTIVKKWLAEQQGRRGQEGCPLIDRKALECGHWTSGDRDLENFKYWHNRLVMLSKVVEKTKLVHNEKWIREEMRTNYWLALFAIGLTLLFRLIQCLEVGIQAFIQLIH